MKILKSVLQFFKMLLILSAFTLPVAFMVSCNEKPKDGKDGAPGVPGQGCTVMQLTNGAEIKCGDETTAVILNGDVGPKGADGSDGKDGENLAAGPYSIREVINPCGAVGAHDEVILRLENGQILGHYSQGQKQFFVLLTQGNYETTDGTKCKFSVDSSLNVTDENATTWLR
jgi:hypothetical protein